MVTREPRDLQSRCHGTESVSRYRVGVTVQSRCHVTESVSRYRVGVTLQSRCPVAEYVARYSVGGTLQIRWHIEEQVSQPQFDESYYSEARMYRWTVSSVQCGVGTLTPPSLAWVRLVDLGALGDDETIYIYSYIQIIMH